MKRIRKLLMIGAGPAQIAGILTAKRLGCWVVAIDGNPYAPGLKVADDNIVCDIKDIDGVFKIAKKYCIEGVLTIASEIALPTVAAVSQKLGFKCGLSLEQANLVTDKGKMRQRYFEAGVASPDFVVLDNDNYLLESLQKVGFPAVMKPVDNAGSRGVYYIESFQEAKDLFDNTKAFSRSGQVIVETFMAGTEVSVEAFVTQGRVCILTLSDKIRTNPPYLLDQAVIFPSAHPVECQNRIKGVAIEAIKALGIDNCPIHMEQMLTPDGPKVVELAARGPGFKVYTEIIPYVTGVDPVEAQIRLLLGHEPNFSIQEPLKGACIRFWGSEKPGVVKRVNGLAEARKFPGIHDLSLYVKKGDRVKRLTCGDARLGHVIVFASTRQEACEVVEKVFQTIQIEIEPE